ncbi:LAFA_0D09846g1_1 [Lachancea sp. 'fantastica']|nr:LAFA_0D09846g1_1 [Lachancea sp. 'fantastica']
MSLRSLALLIQLYLCLAVADLAIVKPESGDEFPVLSNSASFDVEWTDAGHEPDLSSVTQYVFTLCSGPNNKIEAVTTLATVPAGEVNNKKYTVTVNPNAGASGTYFIQVVAISPEWITIHYSTRFTLSGMRGNKAAPKVNEPQSPPPETMRIGPDGPPPPIDSASFKIPYASQSGLTLFAPMQTQPGSKVTATQWTRINPTSVCTFFKTDTIQPQLKTTITAGWDYTVQSRINDAHPRPMPAENGGWYKPADKKTLTARKVNRFVY